jgi:hypothetical protein
VFLVSVLVLGLSGGAIDATLNAYAARTFGPQRISFLHASYGVGTTVSPLIGRASHAVRFTEVEVRPDTRHPLSAVQADRDHPGDAGQSAPHELGDLIVALVSAPKTPVMG